MSPKNKHKNEPFGIPPQANMVLIGGGLYASTARPLIEFGLALSGKNAPNVLLIPTAKDKESTFATFSLKAQHMYREDIGTPVDMLHSYTDMPSTKDLQEKFDKADVLYIAGGNTHYAMNQWKKHGIDGLLTQAMRQGKIIIGDSAGTLAWFNDGFSDAESYEVKKGTGWGYIEVHGLGHIDTIVCPHFNSTQTPDGRVRSEYFKEYLRLKSEKSGSIEFGLGIDNDVALVATGGLVKVLRTSLDLDIHIVSSGADGTYTQSPLNVPKFSIAEAYCNLDKLRNEGITWEDFYLQLSEPVKNPQVVASVSSITS